MKILFVACAFLVSVTSYSQLLYFPKDSYGDSLALRNALPALAKQVIQHDVQMRGQNKVQLWDNLFRSYMICMQYTEAKRLIDSVRHAYRHSSTSAVIGIQYESFMNAKIIAEKEGRPFGSVYPQVLTDLLNNLTDIQVDHATGYLVADVNEKYEAFESYLKKIHDRGQDSIDIVLAHDLCRSYNAYIVYNDIVIHSRAVINSHEQKKFVVEDSLTFTTPRGVTLSGVMARDKNAASALPVILMYNIYPGLGDRISVKNLALRGYVGVVVNTRGKYLSPHEVEPFEHDAEDAYDILEWISHQPWCNGSIGMYGGSYLGFAQWSATKKMHAALKTIVPQVAVGIGIDYPMHNGIFMNYALRWIHYVSNNKTTDAKEFFDEARWNALDKKWYQSGRSFRSLDSIDQRPNKIFQRWLSHPTYDNYWRAMVPHQEEFANINIPVLTTTGYYDDDQRGALYYFNEHYRYNKRANHYLLIGPYDHAGGQGLAKPVLNGYTLDSVAVIDVNETVFSWFDHFFKNAPFPTMLKNKINYQVMGSNKWMHSASLSEMNNDTLQFFLVRDHGRYTLSQNRAASTRKIDQKISLSDRSNADVNTLEFRVVDTVLFADNGITFISDPVKYSIDINGSFCGELKLKINKRDVDVYARLYELMEDGKYVFLSNTVARASYVRDPARRALLTPGREEMIPINNTYFVSRRINPGSRIVLVVGINKNRDWQVNYGTGKDVSYETIEDGKVPLRIEWSSDSWIKLPVRR